MNPLQRLLALLDELEPFIARVVLGHDTDQPLTQAEFDRTYPSTYTSDYPRLAALPDLPAEPGENP